MRDLKNIALVYRKESVKRLSIEKVFKPLEGFSVTKKVVLPYDLTSPAKSIRLLFFALNIREKYIHITGDVHYMAILLFWKPIILVIHDCNHYESLKGLRKMFLGILWFKLPLRIAKKVVVISPFAKKQLQSHFKVSDDKITIIPNSFYAIKPVQYQNVDSIYIILVIGTKANKNIKRLIKAIYQINDIQLNIIGLLSAEQQELLDKYKIKYKNSYNLSLSELEKNYNSSHLLFFASIIEGFGLPILEAQSCGLPVITSNTASMPYVAGNGACIVDPFSVQEIKNAILKIKTNGLYRQQIIDAGFLNIERFGKKAFLKSYKTLYEYTFKIQVT